MGPTKSGLYWWRDRNKPQNGWTVVHLFDAGQGRMRYSFIGITNSFAVDQIPSCEWGNKLVPPATIRSVPWLPADKHKWEVEFGARPGIKVDIGSDSDQCVEAAAIGLGLWKGGDHKFPSFTLYRDGEEIGGG